MENFNIENAKTRFFESKEHYLKFKAAWKAFHNGNELSWREDVDVTPWDVQRSCHDKVYASVKVTPLSAEHYLIYNLLRGYDIHRGFAPLTNEGRINAARNWGGHERPWASLETAVYYVIRAAEDLEKVNIESRVSRKWARDRFMEITKPFGGTLTQEMLLDLGKILHEKAGYRGEFREFEIQEWRPEEQFQAAEFKEELRNPRKTFVEKLGLSKLWGDA